MSDVRYNIGDMHQTPIIKYQISDGGDSRYKEPVQRYLNDQLENIHYSKYSSPKQMSSVCQKPFSI